MSADTNTAPWDAGGRAGASSCQPICDGKTRDAAKLTYVVGGERPAHREGVRSDERVERTYRRAAALEQGADLAMAHSGRVIERHDANLGEQRVEVGDRALRLRALGGTKPQLCQRDRAHPEGGRRMPLQVGAGPLVAIHDRDTDIGIEKKLHNGARRSAGRVLPRRTGRASGTSRSQKPSQLSFSGRGSRITSAPRRRTITSVPGRRIA